jgi:hypothetical protein
MQVPNRMPSQVFKFVYLFFKTAMSIMYISTQIDTKIKFSFSCDLIFVVKLNSVIFLSRVARWFKNPIWVKFGGPWNGNVFMYVL